MQPLSRILIFLKKNASVIWCASLSHCYFGTRFFPTCKKTLIYSVLPNGRHSIYKHFNKTVSRKKKTPSGFFYIVKGDLAFVLCNQQKYQYFCTKSTVFGVVNPILHSKNNNFFTKKVKFL